MWVSRLCFLDKTSCLLWIQTGWSGNCPSWPNGATSLVLQKSRPTSWDLQLGTPVAGMWSSKIHKHIHETHPVSSPAEFPLMNVRQNVSVSPWEHPTVLEKLCVHLELFSSLWRNCVSRGSPQCGATPTWRDGLAVRVKPLLLPSNTSFPLLFFSFCGPVGHFNLTPGFWNLHKGVLFMNSCELLFLWGWIKLTITYFASY